METATPLNKKKTFCGIALSLITLIVGIMLGFFMAELFSGLSRSKLSESILKTKTNHHFGKNTHSNENTTIADKLHEKVRVLCWIMTYSENHERKARHVKETWGKRCNKLLFMSSAEDTVLGTIRLSVPEGRNGLWEKVKEAFKYIYKYHMDDADWFLKADDDTYIVVENLRSMLYPYSPETPVFFGCKLKPRYKKSYMSGGAGYVLSKEAVRRFVTEAIPQPLLCRQASDSIEDINIARCLENVQVFAGDSRDSHGLGRFFPLSPVHHILPKLTEKWYWNMNFYNNNIINSDCCSNNTISFHYVSPEQMHTLEFLLYHLHPYGIVKMPEKLLKK